ncbi:DUF2505 domain-containing protein [Nocardioides ferulae]|uniref:DUF2505 domain-containing protein n=1 Tax=Nocardioides ferulae TaxID=2340821 RepID=UPI000EB489EA|nr:DUF2505 domain-containing protein [Nocardioides ferulae]
MSTRVRHELRYDGSAEQVHAMLTDAAFREEVCERMKVVRGAVTVEPVATGTRVVIEQVQHAGGLPSIATKLVGDTIEIVQEETWTSTTHADVHVTIPHKPGEMIGTNELVEADGATTEIVDLEVRVRVPLVGGKLERLVADNLAKALKVEHAAGQEYLAR